MLARLGSLGARLCLRMGLGPRFINSVNGRAPNRAAERIEKLSPYKPDGTSHSGLLYGGFRLESQPQDLSLCKIYRYGKLRFNEAVSFCRDLEDFRISTSISFKRSYVRSMPHLSIISKEYNYKDG